MRLLRSYAKVLPPDPVPAPVQQTGKSTLFRGSTLAEED